MAIHKIGIIIGIHIGTKTCKIQEFPRILPIGKIELKLFVWDLYLYYCPVKIFYKIIKLGKINNKLASCLLYDNFASMY